MIAACPNLKPSAETVQHILVHDCVVLALYPHIVLNMQFLQLVTHALLPLQLHWQMQRAPMELF